MTSSHPVDIDSSLRHLFRVFSHPRQSERRRQLVHRPSWDQEVPDWRHHRDLGGGAGEEEFHAGVDAAGAEQAQNGGEEVQETGMKNWSW